MEKSSNPEGESVYEQIQRSIREAEEAVRSVRATLQRHRNPSPTPPTVTFSEEQALVPSAVAAPEMIAITTGRAEAEEGVPENASAEAAESVPANASAEDCDDIVVVHCPNNLAATRPPPPDPYDDEVILVGETKNPCVPVIDLCSPCSAPPVPRHAPASAAAPSVPPGASSRPRKRKGSALENTSASSDAAAEAAPPPEKTAAADEVDRFKCVICLENTLSRRPHSTICGHIFCMECIKNAITISKKCPVCRKNLNQKSIHPIFLN